MKEQGEKVKAAFEALSRMLGAAKQHKLTGKVELQVEFDAGVIDSVKTVSELDEAI